jgi:iron complex outermembrane receptor protein
VRITTKYAFVNGWNLDENIPLVNIPAPNILGTLAFFPPGFMKLKDSEISLSGKYVFRQNNLLPEQDFMPPPDGYFLLLMEASTKKELAKSALKFSVFLNNILNVSHRDYLNRLRYFADEPGMSINFGINYSF